MKSKLPACFLSRAHSEKGRFRRRRDEARPPFAGRSGEVHNMSSKRMCKLHGHVTPPAEPGDANLFVLRNAPVAHGRVGCDAVAEQRRGPARSRLEGTRRTKTLIDVDTIGVVEGERQIRAEILEACLASWVGAVEVDQAADCGEVARLELGYCRAGLRDASDDSWPGTIG